MYRKIFCVLVLIQVLLFDGYAEIFRVTSLEGKCLLELPRNMLGRNFLAVSRLDSIGENRFYQVGSRLGNIFLVSFREEENGEIGVYMPDYRMRREVSSVEMRGLLARNQVEWPVMSCPVLEKDGERIVIDITEMMKKGEPFFDCEGKLVVHGGGGDDLFCCTMMREMPVVRRKWKQQNDKMTELPVTTTFFLLSEECGEGRKADRRVGYASVSYDYFKDERSGVYTRHLIQRWALKPRDEVAYLAGQLTEPEMPIVFYLDPQIPAVWKPYFIRGVEDWQQAFETAGFRDAVVARDMPQDERRVLSSTRGMIYYQDSLPVEVVDVNVDPRNGMIVQACVHWSPGILDSLKYEWVTRSGLWNSEFDPEQLSEQIMGELIRVSVGQRVGQALGLLPNEFAAIGCTVEQLSDDTWLTEHDGGVGMMGEVMLNTVAREEDRVMVTNLFPKVGAYECWAINWGYRYWQDEAVGEKIRAEWVQERMKRPENWWYGRSRSIPIKTIANVECVGLNPVWGVRCALENIKKVFERGDLITRECDTMGWGTWVRHSGEKTGMLNVVVLPVLRQIGGVAIVPDSEHKNVLMPLPVDREQQKMAVNFLNQNVFATPQWILKSDLVRKAGVNPEKIIQDWQEAVLEFLFNESLEQLVLNNVMVKSDTCYTMKEFMDDLYEGIWNEPNEGTLDVCRVMLREKYLDILNERLKRGLQGSVSVALQVHLNKLKTMVERVLAECVKEQRDRDAWERLKIKIEDVFRLLY